MRDPEWPNGCPGSRHGLPEAYPPTLGSFGLRMHILHPKTYPRQGHAVGVEWTFCLACSEGAPVTLSGPMGVQGQDMDFQRPTHQLWLHLDYACTFYTPKRTQGKDTRLGVSGHFVWRARRVHP